MARDYSKEKGYNSSPEQKANRAARGRARYAMIKAGKAKVGDGKEVMHKKAISHGGTNKMSNLAMGSVRENRSFARTKTGKMKK